MGWLDHDRLGFNYRLSDIACAIGIAQLARLERMFAGRERMAGWYRRALAGVEGSSCHASTTAGHAAAGSCSSYSCQPAATAIASRRQDASRAREKHSLTFSKS